MCVCNIQFCSQYTYTFINISVWSAWLGCKCADNLVANTSPPEILPARFSRSKFQRQYTGGEPPYHSTYGGCVHGWVRRVATNPSMDTLPANRS